MLCSDIGMSVSLTCRRACVITTQQAAGVLTLSFVSPTPHYPRSSMGGDRVAQHSATRSGLLCPYSAQRLTCFGTTR